MNNLGIILTLVAIPTQYFILRAFRKNKVIMAIDIILCFMLGVVYMITVFGNLLGATVYFSQINQKRKKIYSALTFNPSVEYVDKLIDYVNKYDLPNTPNDWNQLKGVWISVNECPNIPTEKKKELKQHITLRGLTMHHNDAQIIDNYRK